MTGAVRELGVKLGKARRGRRRGEKAVVRELTVMPVELAVVCGGSWLIKKGNKAGNRKQKVEIS